MSGPHPTVVPERIVIAEVNTRCLQSRGTGPTVLLLHGYTDSADTWLPVLKHLSDRGRSAVALDLPYHGKASSPSGVPSLAVFDEFVTAAIEYADAGDGVIVVGNSLGALLAVRSANAATPSLHGLLALAPPGGVISPALRALPRLGPAIVRALQIVPLPNRLVRETVGWAYSLSCTGGKASAHARRTYASHLDRKALIRLVKLGAQVIPEVRNGPPLSVLTVPTTLWWGTRDRVCPARGAGAFAGVGNTVIAPGRPHCPQVADPGLVLSLLDELEVHIADPPTQPNVTGPARFAAREGKTHA